MSKRKTKTKAQKQKRKAKFLQNKKSQNNQIKKMQEAYLNQMTERHEIMKRANIIEQIHNSRPEMAHVVDGVLQINDEIVEEKDEVLYWKKDDNPLMAGLEAFENYSKYSKEFVNQVLTVVQAQQEQQKVQAAEQTTPVDLDGFDLIEDEDFEIVEEVETETEAETQTVDDKKDVKTK